VEQRLGRRNLVWAGIRGEDIEPLTELPQLSGSFCIIGRYGRRRSVESLAFEDLSGRRVDLETWDIDDHLETEEALTFRRAILSSLSRPSALLTYRPSRFLSAIWFARRERTLNLGLFGAHQSAFEHKPWVETAVAALGVPHIQWKYVADEEQLLTPSLIDQFPIMLRRSRTSGGEGIVRVDSPDLVPSMWPRGAEAFASVSPFLEDVLPINLGGTVWRDAVTVHYPSIQLIGIPGCGQRPFGYCGNDFGLSRTLEPSLLDQMEESTKKIGSWLGSHGYRGTFGVDFLVHEGVPLFTEVNPRFQGSTHLSCRISVEQGEPCLMLEHLASTLDLPATTRPPLRAQVRDLPDMSHVVVHWSGTEAARVDPLRLIESMRDHGSAIGADVRTRPSLITDPEGVVARITVGASVTVTGFELREPWSSIVTAWTSTAGVELPSSSPTAP
jgi:hypothetical protein